MIRVPVFTVVSDDAIVFMKIPIKSITVETEQIHSVSLTHIKEYYLVSGYDIQLYKVDYEDQGGAGMPNHKDIVLDNTFTFDLNIRYNDIYMMVDKNNYIKINGKSIPLNVSEYGSVELSIKRQFLVEYLFKVGVL